MKSQLKYHFAEIRRQSHEYHKHYDFSGYTGLKLRFYIESAAILTYLLQYTRISPNAISYLYGFLGILGGALLTLPYRGCIISALIIIYIKGILDSVDGHLARITNKATDFGRQLDIWTGTVGTVAFYIGLGFYISHHTNLYLVAYVPILAIILRYWLQLPMGRARIIDTIILVVGIHAYLT